MWSNTCFWGGWGSLFHVIRANGASSTLFRRLYVMWLACVWKREIRALPRRYFLLSSLISPEKSRAVCIRSRDDLSSAFPICCCCRHFHNPVASSSVLSNNIKLLTAPVGCNTTPSLPLPSSRKIRLVGSGGQGVRNIYFHTVISRNYCNTDVTALI